MITQQDYTEIKKKLKNTKTRIQFRNGNKIDSLGYQGSLGEPILLKDKLTFSICDGKNIDNRKEYEITKNAPGLDSLIEYLEHMILFFLEKTPVGTLTAKFAMEGSILTRSKLIQAFTNTNKFCIPDGRSLPSNCYAYKVLGISSAPKLSGRFLRHYDSDGSTDSSGSRSLGHTQEDSYKSHHHGLDFSRINFKGNLVEIMNMIYRSADTWYTWYLNEEIMSPFITGYTSQHIDPEYLLPPFTRQSGSKETKPKNTCYISFYRYDL
ncbi:hypothetical protein CV657_05150 [Borreliella burgdorferi]|uniref:hypothetical protein n=1 Tax=Borreliella burgdorferi TaxID=139 RepID=UPI000D02EB79|nr:hypothetical protein [Borreliella burgdorferi]PRR01381.1 hypothetical protein CV665_05010 [Borreliella burgdorferi]PRR09749.1 hypothetical protein CV663_04515 [Borreliella burgdorferi]PRR50707.1 hypothetical protein CV666_04990 [Borreliella burgdorferi]PRR58248.1 hypothetical protein CV657_05150 [Borreliella burgdorferi]